MTGDTAGCIHPPIGAWDTPTHTIGKGGSQGVRNEVLRGSEGVREGARDPGTEELKPGRQILRE